MVYQFMNKYILLVIILLFPAITSAVQYACPNNTQVISNSEEIENGQAKSILSLPIGVCGTSESSYFHWIESTIFLDSRTVLLGSTNETKGTELISENKSISYSLISGETVTLKVGSSTSELDLGECSEIGGIVAMIKSIDELNADVEVLVGTKKVTLNTKEKPSEIIEVNLIKYGVQLLTGSSAESTIKLNKCSIGDIYELAEQPIIQVQNVTNSTVSNNTIIPNQTIINETQTNQTIQNNTLNQTSIKEIKEACATDNECVSNYCKNNICTNKGFFNKIFDWFKSLF